MGIRPCLEGKFGKAGGCAHIVSIYSITEAHIQNVCTGLMCLHREQACNTIMSIPSDTLQTNHYFVFLSLMAAICFTFFCDYLERIIIMQSVESIKFPVEIFCRCG